jgi:hypothetical protein
LSLAFFLLLLRVAEAVQNGVALTVAPAGFRLTWGKCASISVLRPVKLKRRAKSLSRPGSPSRQKSRQCPRFDNAPATWPRPDAGAFVFTALLNARLVAVALTPWMEQLRQLGDIRCDPPRLVAREQLGRRSPGPHHAACGRETSSRARASAIVCLMTTSISASRR